MRPPLISSQRYLDPRVVRHKAENFKVFVVRTVEIDMRGKSYSVMLDGHHNLAAARMIGADPMWRGPSAKIARIMSKTPAEQFAAFLINNLTDSDWFYVDTGDLVRELLPPAERNAL